MKKLRKFNTGPNNLYMKSGVWHWDVPLLLYKLLLFGLSYSVEWSSSGGFSVPIGRTSRLVWFTVEARLEQVVVVRFWLYMYILYIRLPTSSPACHSGCDVIWASLISHCWNVTKWSNEILSHVAEILGAVRTVQGYNDACFCLGKAKAWFTLGRWSHWSCWLLYANTWKWSLMTPAARTIESVSIRATQTTCQRRERSSMDRVGTNASDPSNFSDLVFF